ncbi:MAG: hypothetical protein V8S24_14745 [Gordonibacter pamelaeae]
MERRNAGDLGGGSLNMAVQFTVLPAFILTLVCSVSLFAVTRAKKGATRSQRLRTAGVQLAATAALSCCVGFGVAGIAGIAGLAIPVAETGLFLWLASFCLMTFFVGCLDIAVGLGALVIVAVFACGLRQTGNLPYEFLPAIWQEWRYRRFIAEGARSLYYLGGSAWNASAGRSPSTASSAWPPSPLAPAAEPHRREAGSAPIVAPRAGRRMTLPPSCVMLRHAASCVFKKMREKRFVS